MVLVVVPAARGVLEVGAAEVVRGRAARVALGVVSGPLVNLNLELLVNLQHREGELYSNCELYSNWSGIGNRA